MYNELSQLHKSGDVMLEKFEDLKPKDILMYYSSSYSFHYS